MPKPSVALCAAKPMIRIVARPISPARAETPMARPSEVVQADRRGDDQAGAQRPRPCGRGQGGGLLRGQRIDAAAGERRHVLRAPCAATLDQRQADDAEEQAGDEHQREADRAAGVAAAVARLLDGVLDDLEPVARDVHEEEGQDADREHRQRDLRAGADALHPRHWEAEEDREAGDGAEGSGLCE